MEPGISWWTRASQIFSLVLTMLSVLTPSRKKVSKNWCFQTVMLEKTLEGHSDCKEIKPVNSKGNLPWIFIGGLMMKLNSLFTWCKELTHWKRPWCWERLKAGGEWGNRGWDGWMASPTQWTWVWINSGRWWRTRKPGVLQSMVSQTVGQDWVTEQQQKWHQSLQLKKKKIIHLARWSIWSEAVSRGLGWAHACVSGKNWAYWPLGLWPLFFFTWPVNFQSTSFHSFPWQPQGPSAVRKGESWCSGVALPVSLAPSFLTSCLVK